MNACKKQVLTPINGIHCSAGAVLKVCYHQKDFISLTSNACHHHLIIISFSSSYILLKVIDGVTSVFIIAAIFIESIFTNEGYHVLFVTWCHAAIVVCTIVCFTVWIGMYQAANFGKVRQALMSSFEPSDDATTVKAVEPNMFIFVCLYNYLETLLLQKYCNASLIIGDTTSIYIGICSFQAKSFVGKPTKSVKRLPTKFHKKSFALIMLAVLSVSSLLRGSKH